MPGLMWGRTMGSVVGRRSRYAARKRASSPDVATVSGEYFYKCKIDTPTKAAQSDADAKKLWDVSAKISGVG